MNIKRTLHLILASTLFLTIPGLSGCSSSRTSTNQQENAINTIRAKLDLPNSPLTFVEMTSMANSPNSSLVVAVYQDSQGRKYSVEPKTNQVVEIDARSVLSNIPPNALALTEGTIRARAMKFISAAIPDFENLKSQWTYEEGGKIDNYFFSWYGQMTNGSMNRPFAQIGLHKTGVLFAYYNTLLLEK